MHHSTLSSEVFTVGSYLDGVESVSADSRSLANPSTHYLIIIIIINWLRVYYIIPSSTNMSQETPLGARWNVEKWFHEKLFTSEHTLSALP